LREDVRSPATSLGLDSFVMAQNESPVYGQNLHSHVDSGSQSPSDILSISSGSNYDLTLQSTYDP